jgi:FkbH-like protein
MTALHWLPPVPDDWRARLRALDTDPAADPDQVWAAAVALAQADLSFVLTNNLDQAMRRALPARPPGLATRPERLALLGSATMGHLVPAIRVGGLRRGIWIDTYENEFGQYWQELTDPGSALRAFRPSTVLVALDAYHVAAGIDAGLDAEASAAALDDIAARLREIWRLAREAFGCKVIQQTVLPVHPPVLGSNEHRLPGSRAAFVARLNALLRPMADQAGVDLLALDERAARDGLTAWHNPTFWHHGKQEVTPAAAPMYGDLIARLLAAHQGRSAKCLVLDLDNTLWGGVVGDDGLEGIVIGQGSAAGEAYLAFQLYCRELARRGVILAVCSKNDEANALEPFERHPEMALKQSDIAAFAINWSDKPANIRAIATELNIGLDALVFVDDNPFERNLVRRELPMVAVPEVGEDPVGFIAAIADAGYFEALAITEEDRERTVQYHGNRAREALRSSATDLEGYLRGLEMRLVWRGFDRIGLARTVQLINKSNQFNLTTRRYTEAEVLAVMDDPTAFGLQLRLIDRFGDNGVIAIVIGRKVADRDLMIDTWLMSCRVLGRQVEEATLELVAQQAKLLRARRLIGEYIPTKKNGMVKDHYAKLGFTVMETTPAGGSRAVLDLHSFVPTPSFIHIEEG